MQKRTLCFLGFLLWVPFLPAGATGAGMLTVATYNVENYTLADRLVDGVYRQGYPKPEAEKQAVRAVIRGLDADVLALQEIGGRPFLEELRRDLRSEGLDYPVAESFVAGDPDRQLAVLSRRPLKAVRRHDDLAFKYFGRTVTVKRGLLEVRLAAPGGDLTLFVVHLKSRYTDRADDPSSALLRAAEATAVRDRVLAIFPDPAAARFMILGDFNDSRASRPLRALLERGSTTISEWLPAADSRGHYWSHWYKREDSYTRVDHLLVSPGLKPAVVNGTGRIYDADEVARASDHRPLVVRLAWE